MKIAFLVVCLVLGSATSSPLQHSFGLETLLEEVGEGYQTASKVVEVAHKIERLVVTLKETVPHLYHEYKDVIELLRGEIGEIVSDIKYLLNKQNYYYGFDLLDGLTELTDGTKLSTVLRLLSLADKAHKFVNDLKHAVPDAKERLHRVLNDLENSMTDLVHHVIRELGGDNFLAAVPFLEELEEIFDEFADKTLGKVVDLVVAMEGVIRRIEDELPVVAEDVRHLIRDIRQDFKDIMRDLKTTFLGYSFLDVMGDLTDGTKLGTVMKVVSLIDKFNTLVKDVKQLEPRAEAVLEHSVSVVANHAQEFLNHASDLLYKEQY
ncbi:uncharacterized protein LOC111632277 [Centruroides sculpturatus]|uniref:uncharacterized protein LOC111632277 n=2 Tax=Centruroides sculpturatus TaxID=218467 RepID=UPI000C6D0540|nr:uncharacterized protein LOC111632277 [Centruroides sculpturatus]